jgi:hypothetical protein
MLTVCAHRIFDGDPWEVKVDKQRRKDIKWGFGAGRLIYSQRFRRLKLFRFLKLLRWSPAPPR